MAKWAVLLLSACILGDVSGFVPAGCPLARHSCRTASTTATSGVMGSGYQSGYRQHHTSASSFGYGRSNRQRGGASTLRMGRNFYEVLEIPQGSDAATVKKAFRKLARQYHPDVNPDPAAEEKFKEMSYAYEILSDAEKKERYDQFGEAGIGGGQGGSGGVGIDLGDIFETFFGGGGGGGRGGGRQRGPQRGDDLRVDLDLDFKTACFGGEEKVRIRHYESCDVCTGSGVKPGAKVSTCTQCNGMGVVMQVQRTPLGNFQSQATCPNCRGTGEQVEEYCGSCSGKGLVERSKQVKVRIPPGVDDGNKLRVKGEGDAGPKGAPTGDLYVFINVQKDPRFERDGTSIYSDISISYLDAILGNPEVIVSTIDGEVQMKVPAGTQPNTTLRIRGKGVPQLNNKDSRGDHYVKVKVDIPTSPSKEEKELIKKLQELSSGKRQTVGSGKK